MAKNEKNRCVFLLGAGFSANKHPVMSQFMKRARARCDERARRRPPRDLILDAYKTMFDFQNACYSASRVSTLNFENMEHLYTQADLMKSAKLKLTIGKGSERQVCGGEVCEAIRWAIWDVYQKRYDRRSWPRVIKPIFESMQKAGWKPAIITTNYDVVCEQVLKGDHFYPGFEPAQTGKKFIVATTADSEEPKNERRIPIVKLHGSVNWFGLNPRKSGFDSSCAALMDLKLKKFGSADFKLQPFRKNVGKMLSPQDIDEIEPLIVPPTLGKHADAALISAQWRTAIDFLSQARDIWVIGYSFPETDTFMSRLWAQALKDNKHLQRIIIVNREPRDRWDDRLSALFPDSFRSTFVRYVSLTATEFLTRLKKELQSEKENYNRVVQRIFDDERVGEK